MLTDSQLRICGLDTQPDQASAYRIQTLLDLHGGSVQRLLEILAKENLLAIGTKLGQPNADAGKLSRESYFWGRVPELFLFLAQQVAVGATQHQDTLIDD